MERTIPWVEQLVPPVEYRVLFSFFMFLVIKNRDSIRLSFPVPLDSDQTKFHQLSCCSHFGIAQHLHHCIGQHDLTSDMFPFVRFKQNCERQLIRLALRDCRRASTQRNGSFTQSVLNGARFIVAA